MSNIGKSGHWKSSSIPFVSAWFSSLTWNTQLRRMCWESLCTGTSIDKKKVAGDLNSFYVCLLRVYYELDSLPGTDLIIYSRSNVLPNHRSTESSICTFVFHMPDYFKPFPSAIAKSNMKTLKHSLQPCFSITNAVLFISFTWLLTWWHAGMFSQSSNSKRKQQQKGQGVQNKYFPSRKVYKKELASFSTLRTNYMAP